MWKTLMSTFFKHNNSSIATVVLAQYGHNQSKKKWGLRAKYHRSIKVHTQESQNQHHLKPSFQTQIYLVKVPLNVNIVKKILSIKNSFWKFHEVRSKRTIVMQSSNADSGPLRYFLWCCVSICQELFTFIYIGSGHTVSTIEINFS